MSTYRTGNHWGITIVREGEHIDVGVLIDDDQLVAVVVNGDQELAERIADLLNAPTPDVPYTCGAREALAAVRLALGAGGEIFPEIEQLLRDVAAELGVSEDAPSSPLSAPVSASEPQTQGSPRAEGAEAISGRCRKCGSRLDVCTNCGEPALCGEPWCAQCQPESGWTDR